MTIKLSRSEQKRRIKEVEQLVRELVELPEPVLKKLPGDEEIRLLIIEAQGLKGGARKRQIKYITKVLKNEPLAGLYKYLADRNGGTLQQKKQFHALEYFRDSLLNEAIARRKELAANQEELTENWDSSTLDAISRELPLVDLSALRRLAAMYARTRQNRHSREIFRLLRAAGELARQREKEKQAKTT
ncbi:MAG TPA: DUF615 domain-containing protein [Desulfobulbus sp.]|nr:DUF615 domain-containing protein [Desulfobulbus sp.]